MDELLGALLSGLGEIFVEVFLELAGEAILEAIVRTIRNFFGEPNATNPVLASAGYLLLGAGFGMLSTFIFPHPLIHRTRFHGISLLVSPVLTGLVMSQLGRALRRRGKDSLQIESFGYGFAFALGVALVRFFWVS